MRFIEIHQEDIGLMTYLRQSPWPVGRHLADLVDQEKLGDWERIIVGMVGDKPVSYASFLKTDYYPDTSYWPWISSIYVDEGYRGQGKSYDLIAYLEAYARSLGFDKVYIPSSIEGLYEKSGYKKVDCLKNYGGDWDYIFMKELRKDK